MVSINQAINYDYNPIDTTLSGSDYCTSALMLFTGATFATRHWREETYLNRTIAVGYAIPVIGFTVQSVVSYLFPHMNEKPAADETSVASASGEDLPSVAAGTSLAPASSEDLPSVAAQTSLAPASSEDLPSVAAETSLAPASSEDLPSVAAETSLAPASSEDLPSVAAETSVASASGEDLPSVAAETSLAPASSEDLRSIDGLDSGGRIEIGIK